MIRMIENPFPPWSNVTQQIATSSTKGRLCSGQVDVFKGERIVIQERRTYTDPSAYFPGHLLNFSKYFGYGTVEAIGIKIGNDKPVAPDNGFQHTFHSRYPIYGEVVVVTLVIVAGEPTDPNTWVSGGAN